MAKFKGTKCHPLNLINDIYVDNEYVDDDGDGIDNNDNVGNNRTRTRFTKQLMIPMIKRTTTTTRGAKMKILTMMTTRRSV